MSEDPPTPALRLKPRLRLEGTPPAGEKLPPPPAGEAESGTVAVAVLPPEGAPLKLRPRVSLPNAPILPATPLTPPVAAPAPTSAVPATPPSTLAVPVKTVAPGAPPFAAQPPPLAAVAAPLPAPALAPPPAPVGPVAVVPVVPLLVTPGAPSPVTPAVPPTTPVAAVSPPVVKAPTPVPAASPAPALLGAAVKLSAPALTPVAPTAPGASPPATPAPAPTPAGESVDASRFRLKPRVAAPEGAPAPVPPGVISTKPLVAALPPLPGAPPPLAVAPASSPPSFAATPLPKVASAVPPSIKVVSPTPPPMMNPAGLPSAARMTVPSNPSDSTQLPENTRAFKLGIWAVTTVVVVVAGAGAFYAYRFLHPKEEAVIPTAIRKPATPQTKPVSPPVNVADEPGSPPVHEPVVASPQSLPGRMVGKARDVVAARDQSGQVSGVGEILNDTSPEVPPPVREKPPGRPVKVVTNGRDTPLDASTPPAEEVVDKPAAPPPTIAFRTFVANLRVSGVFQGEPGRALLNGKTIRIGDIADNTLGIRLVRLDVDRKILYFEDATGATMQRRY